MNVGNTRSLKFQINAKGGFFQHNCLSFANRQSNLKYATDDDD